MKLTIVSTPYTTTVGGVQCRVWRVDGDERYPVVVFVHRIAVPSRTDETPFAAELLEQEAPSMLVPLHDVLY